MNAPTQLLTAAATADKASALSRRRKILFAITRGDTGGAQNHVRDLLEGLGDSFDLTLAVGEEGPLTQCAHKLGVRVYLIPALIRSVSPHHDLRALLDLRALIRSTDPDLVHTHSTKAGLLGRIAATLSRVPSIFTAHGWAFEEGVPPLQKLVAIPSEWLAARCCNRIITVCEAGYSLARKYRIASAGKMEVIYNGIPDAKPRARPAEGSPPVIVMVARFSRQKDQSVVLRAVAKLQLDFRLVFVGDGPTRASVESEARSSGLKSRVDFLGDRADVPTLLANSQVFALGTNWEGLPISILEAMRAGLPVVASDVGGVREQVVDGETGFVVTKGDAALMGERLSRLVTQPQLRAQMGSAGRRRFERMFSVAGMLEKTLQIYSRVNPAISPQVR